MLMVFEFNFHFLQLPLQSLFAIVYTVYPFCSILFIWLLLLLMLSLSFFCLCFPDTSFSTSVRSKWIENALRWLAQMKINLSRKLNKLVNLSAQDKPKGVRMIDNKPKQYLTLFRRWNGVCLCVLCLFRFTMYFTFSPISFVRQSHSLYANVKYIHRSPDCVVFNQIANTHIWHTHKICTHECASIYLIANIFRTAVRFVCASVVFRCAKCIHYLDVFPAQAKDFLFHPLLPTTSSNVGLVFSFILENVYNNLIYFDSKYHFMWRNTIYFFLVRSADSCKSKTEELNSWRKNFDNQLKVAWMRKSYINLSLYMQNFQWWSVPIKYFNSFCSKSFEISLNQYTGNISRKNTHTHAHTFFAFIFICCWCLYSRPLICHI